MAHYTIVCKTAKATYVHVDIAQYCRYDFLIAWKTDQIDYISSLGEVSDAIASWEPWTFEDIESTISQFASPAN